MEKYAKANMLVDDSEHLLFVGDIFDFTDVNASVQNARLATDNHGQAFRQQAVSYMKNYVSADMISEVLSWKDVMEEYDIDSDEFKKLWENSIENGEKALEDSEKLCGEGFGKTGTKAAIKQTFFTLTPETVRQFALGWDYLKVSHKTIDLSETLFHRETETGNWEQTKEVSDPTDILFFDEYILDKMGYFGEEKEDTMLSYETEYVLIGLPADQDNFGMVLDMIILLRAAADFYTLYSDETYKGIVDGISDILATATGIPPEVYSALIFCLWAAVEGTYDAGQLAKGEKMPLVKSSNEIHTSIEGLLGDFSKDIPESDSETVPSSQSDITNISLGYKDYLRLFLSLLPSDIKTERVMDLIELNLNLSEENRFFNFNACIDAVNMECTYESGYGYVYTLTRRYSFF